MVQWMAYSLIADSACSLLISLTSQLQKTGTTDGSRYLFLALAVWAKAAPIFGRFLFFGIVQLLVCSCIETTGCRWGVSYALRDKSVERTITIIMTIVLLLPTKRFEVVSWFECSCSGQTMSTRGNHNVNRLSISSRPELPGTSCSWHTLGRRPRTFVAFLLIGVGWGGIITFICTSSHIWCYVIVWGGVGWGNNVHLHFLTYMMLRYCMLSCTSSHIWCYASSCRLALPHIHDATLLYVILHFLTYMMLRYFMSSCTSSHTWCQTTSKRWWTNGSLDKV